MIKIKSIKFILITIFVFTLTTQTTFAAYKTLEKIPGVNGADFPSYVTGIYNFAIAVVLIAALLMITIGGFYYITSAGNQAQATTAKKLITDALLGLVVVFLIYLVLNKINPDLLNASPNLGALQDGVGESAKSKKERGKAAQVDTWCKKGGGDSRACQDDKATCELLNGGAGSCTQSSKALDPKKAYIVEDGNMKEFDGTYAECLNAGHICQTGANAMNDLRYGVKNQITRAKLENGDKISVATDARTDNLSDKSIDKLKKFADDVGADGSRGTSIHIDGVEPDGRTVKTNTASKRVHDYMVENGALEGNESWGIDSNGGKYYKITKGPLKGSIVKDSPSDSEDYGAIILPNEDGSNYSLEDLGLKDNISDDDDDDDWL